MKLHKRESVGAGARTGRHTMVVGGDNGAVVIALDQSSLIQRVVPARTDFHHFIGILDRLMYASPTSTDSKTFKAVRGTSRQCAARHVRNGKAIPRTHPTFRTPEINGWIPVATSPTGEAGQVFRVYDENGVVRGFGAAAGIGPTELSPSSCPRSGASVAHVVRHESPAGRSRSMPSPTGGCSSGHCRWDSFSFGSPEPPSRTSSSSVDSYGGPTRTIDTTTWTMASLAGDLHEVADAVFSRVAAPAHRKHVRCCAARSETPRRSKSQRSLSGATDHDQYLHLGSGLAMTDDSRYLLTALDGRARLWDLATGEPISDAIGNPIDLGNVPSRQQVLSGSVPRYLAMTGGLLQIWRFDVDHYSELACQATGRNMTQQEWERSGPRTSPTTPRARNGRPPDEIVQLRVRRRHELRSLSDDSAR